MLHKYKCTEYLSETRIGHSVFALHTFIRCAPLCRFYCHVTRPTVILCQRFGVSVRARTNGRNHISLHNADLSLAIRFDTSTKAPPSCCPIKYAEILRDSNTIPYVIKRTCRNSFLLQEIRCSCEVLRPGTFVQHV